MNPPTSLLDLPVHDAIGDWTAAALTDDLSASERRLFEDHLAGCSRCRAQFAEDTAMSHTLQDVFVAAGPLPGFERRLTAAFRQRRESGLAGWFRVPAHWVIRHPAGRIALATAAAVALVALGGNLTHESAWSGGSRVLPRSRAALNSIVVDQFPDAVVTAKEGVPLVVSGPSVDNEKALESTKDGEKALPKLKSDQTVGGVVAISEDARRLSQPDSLRTYDVNGGQAAGGMAPASRLDEARETVTMSGHSSGKAQSDQTPAKFEKQDAGVTLDQKSSGSPAAPAAPAVAPPETRKLIRNASLELEVDAFDPAVDALGAAAAQTGGGYVATVNSSRGANGKRSGVIVIKVQPDQLDAFLTRLREIGEVKGQTVAAEDVTKEYFDTDARLRNARRMEDRLLKLLDEAKGKLSEILQVEKELGRVREDLERMQGELQRYDSLVRFATVTVDLHEKDLQAPAAFLLRQTAELSLLAPDVEKTYADARRVAEEAHAQITASDLVRSADGRVNASLHLILAPVASDAALARLKALARVGNFTVRDERVAQNGNGGGDSAADAHLERGPVTLNLSIGHDEESHRRVTSTLFAANPAGAFDAVRAAGVAAGAEVVSSNFNRTRGVHGAGALVLRVPASKEGALLEAVRALGRVSDLDIQRDNNAAPDADAAPTFFTLNVADEPAHRRVSLTLIAPNLDAAFDGASAAAMAAGGEISTSSFHRTDGAHGAATLALLVPAKGEAAVMAALRSLGQNVDLNVERDAAAAPEEASANAPVAITINLADEQPAIQRTSATVLCVEVDQRQAELRRITAEAGGQVRSSTFQQETEGREEADLVIRVPLRAYAGFMARIAALGEVKDLSVHRQDRPQNASADAGAPAEVSLRLYNQGRLVSDASGLGATIRRTLAQGAAALTWSLRMIGVALAFLAPWVAAAFIVAGLARFFARRRHLRATRSKDTKS